jgi:hypothetical protein
MTTPPTPADWYPDPENPAGLRYWDGTAWTEHRASAPVAADEAPAAETPAEQPAAKADEFPASEQSTSVVPLPEQSSTEPPDIDHPTTVVPHGAHRAPDETGQEPPATSYPTPSQPYDTHPPTTFEPPGAPDETPWDAPLPSWDSPSPAAEHTDTPPPSQPYEGQSYERQSYEPAGSSVGQPYEGQPYEGQSYERAAFTPPPGPPGPPAPPTGPASNKPNTKLVVGILGGAAAILIALVLVIVFVVIRRDEPTVTSQGPSSTKSSTASSETSTESPSESSSSESPTPTPPPTGGEGSDGDFTFSVAGTETGDTITSPTSDAVQTTADGMFYVVYVNVSNTGTSPLTFVATFQQLNAQGTTYPLDDEATAFLGGTVADIAPGDKVETPLVYDVPVGTAPDSILLRADPASPGVTLPLQ